MMRAVTKAGAAAVMAMTVVGMSGTAWAQKGQKGKPGLPPNAVGSVTMDDGPDYELTSDGFGAYEGATIYGSGTLLLELSTLPSRQMVINLRDGNRLVTTSVDHAVYGTYAANADLRVDNIDHAPVSGGWVRSVGRIGFGTGLPKHALGFRYTTANGVPVYGTEVCVRRVPSVSPATWQIASSDACSADGGAAGLFEEGLKGKGYRFEAVYKVRFLATVVCTSGSTCPQ